MCMYLTSGNFAPLSSSVLDSYARKLRMSSFSKLNGWKICQQQDGVIKKIIIKSIIQIFLFLYGIYMWIEGVISWQGQWNDKSYSFHFVPFPLSSAYIALLLSYDERKRNRKDGKGICCTVFHWEKLLALSNSYEI